MSRFFVDRSLGGKSIARLFRDAGWDVTTMNERYGRKPGERVADTRWIAEMTAEGCALLSSDHKILINPIERKAITEAGARVFALPIGSLSGPVMVARYEAHRANIERKAVEPGPAGFVVYERYLSRVYP